MKLSAVLLREELSEYIILWKYGSFSGELNLKYPEYYWNQLEFLSGHVYIAFAEELPVQPVIQPGSCIISIGQPGDAYFEQEGSVFVLSKQYNIHALSNHLYRIYEIYHEWDHALQDCVNKELPMQRIVDLSEMVLKNPINIADQDYRLLAVSKSDPKNSPPDMEVIDIRYINLLKQAPAFQTLFSSNAPTILLLEQYPYRLLAYAIQDNGKLSAFVTLGEFLRPFRESDNALIIHMSYYISLLYEKNIAKKYNRTEVLSELFIRALDQSPPTDQEWREVLGKFQWLTDHMYGLFLLPLNQKDFTYNTMHRLCTQFEELIGQAVAFTLEQNIVVVVNISCLSPGLDPARLLYDEAKASKLKLASAPKFQDIKKIVEYYIQAQAALELGRKKNPKRGHYRFEDYRFEYLLQACSRELKPEYLAPDGLLALYAHDRKKGTQYVKTLRAYFQEESNATKAAKALYVHRTTFLDRFEKIKEILRVDFGDPRIRLHLMLALELLEQ